SPRGSALPCLRHRHRRRGTRRAQAVLVPDVSGLNAAAGAEIGTIRAARVVAGERDFLSEDDPVDIFLAGGVIVDIAPTGALPAHGEVLEASGAWVLPGLWDAHVHTVQWALSAQRTPLGEARSAREAAALMAD